VEVHRCAELMLFGARSGLRRRCTRRSRAPSFWLKKINHWSKSN